MSIDGLTWESVIFTAPFIHRECHEQIVYNGKLWIIGRRNNMTSFNDVWYLME